MKTAIQSLLYILLFCTMAFSQTIMQSINGKLYDDLTHEPLPYANIIVVDSDPLIGTTSDMNGNFSFKVPVGRHNIQISMMGYETRMVNELLVSAGQQAVLNIGMQQATLAMDELVVTIDKDIPLNSMKTVSSRQFTVEETQRYAGGMDDPARLASSFAGVATPSVSANGISVRGNNPQGLLWRIEGVETPNPNHFADLTVTGGGLLTALSNQMMGNSDFYTGAFPAEYGNATSGVFDINLKTGNPTEREYTVQTGVLGVDFSAQGPFVKGKEASYLMNYRYSTMALVSPLLPDDTGILKYQDLAFKTNFPTDKAGTFSLWGIGALDGQEMTAADSVDWESDFDRDNSQTRLYMFATGLSHKIAVNSSTFLNTTIAATGNGLNHEEQRVDTALSAFPQSDVTNDSWRYTIQSSIGKRFNKRHSNQSGFYYHQLAYRINAQQSQGDGEALSTLADQSGNSALWQVYSQSKISLSPKLTLNAGVYAQYFVLNKKLSVEPRFGLKYNVDDKQNIAIAFGQHSRIERLPLYFVEIDGAYPNKKLDLMKSAHYVLAYNRKLSDNMRLCIEPYYQHLNDVPVAPDNYVSSINVENDIFFNHNLVSQGIGRNMGVDFTLERFLNKGFYYLLTASLFDAQYRGADGEWRNTRFNKNYILNVLAGKEWHVGKEKNNIFSANVRFNYAGGNRKEPIDVQSSIAGKKVIYAETDDNMAFEDRFEDMPVFSFTFSYRKNKPNHSSVWSLQILNVNGAKEYSNDYYNLKTGDIETRFDGIFVPNLSYRLEF